MEKNGWTQWELQQKDGNTRKYQRVVKGLKNTVTKLKNALEKFSNRLEEAGERISQLRDKAVELKLLEQQNENGMMEY